MLSDIYIKAHQHARAQCDRGDSCSPAALKVEELMAALKKKDDDMRAMEERYKMYLEKARNVSDACLETIASIDDRRVTLGSFLPSRRWYELSTLN